MPPPPPRHDPLIEKLAWLLDQSIPLGGKWRIGIDGVLGLIPGIGDLSGAALSTIIIARASMAGVPRVTLIRMMANVAIDSLLGAIPLVGDLFDFVYKANTKNLRLYQEAMRTPRGTRRDWAFLILLLIVLAIVVAIPLLAIAALIRQWWV